MTWSFAVGPGASGDNIPSTELTEAYGRVVTWRVDGHAFAQFSIDGRAEETAEIRLLESDLWAWRDGADVFHGRIVGAQPDLNEDRHVVQFQAIDYRGMLSAAAKIEPPIPTFSQVDQAQIVWDLVQHRQAQTGGDWGIVEGLGSTSGQLRDESDITPGSPVGDVIDRVLRRENGGEWEISPDLVLNRWFPQRGSDNGVVLDLGGALTQIKRTTPEFGNAAVATGDQTTSTATAQTPDVGTDPRGRWTVSQGFPTVSVQSTVAAKAAWLRDEASTIEHEWAVTLAPEVWEGPDNLWIGDTVTLSVNDGWLTESGKHRVVELQATPGDDGTETIRLGLVGVPT